MPAVAARALKPVARLHDRTPDELLGQVSVSPNETTNILTFTVVDQSPTISQLLATSYARAFTAYSNQLTSKPIVKAEQRSAGDGERSRRKAAKAQPLY